MRPAVITGAGSPLAAPGMASGNWRNFLCYAPRGVALAELVIIADARRAVEG